MYRRVDVHGPGLRGGEENRTHQIGLDALSNVQLPLQRRFLVTVLTGRIVRERSTYRGGHVGGTIWWLTRDAQLLI